MYVCYVLFNKYSKYRITGGPNHGNKEAKQNIELSQHAQTPSAVQVAKCRHRLNENFPSHMGQYGLMSNLFELLLAVVSSVLSCCWLGIRKSIWPVKIEWWGVGVVICLERGADCLHIIQLMPLHPKTLSSLASLKSRLVLPFCVKSTEGKSTNGKRNQKLHLS